MRAGRSRVTRRYLAAAAAGGALGGAQFQGAESLSAPQGGVNPLSHTGNIDARIIFWLAIDQMPAGGAFQDVIRCMGTAGGTGGWQILLSGTSQSLVWQPKDTGVLQAAVDFGVALPTAEWLYCDFAHDNSGGGAAIVAVVRKTDGTALINAITASGFCGPVHTSPLQMGTGDANDLEGRLSKVGVWLAAQPWTDPPDATYMFNSGAGRTGAEVLAGSAPTWGDPVNLKGYWDLNEATGETTWPDTQTVHDATATGTIVAVSGPPTY